MDLKTIWAVDRVENEMARLENMKTGDRKDISCKFLPEGVKESDIVVEGDGVFEIDIVATQKRKEKMQALFRRGQGIDNGDKKEEKQDD